MEKNTMLLPRTASYGKNMDKGYAVGNEGCCICGRPIKTEGHTLWLWEHHGGNQIVTEEEGKKLPQDRDMGLQPVGSCCLKKNAKLKPFLITHTGLADRANS